VYHASGTALRIDAAGDTTRDVLAAQHTTISAPSGACPGSLRAAAMGNTLVVVWWSPRADSSARLLSARSTNGGATWTTASVVDSLDRSVTGCRRPAASIAADAMSGYVHVAYGLVAPEGTGIFFAHSMDNGVTFHSPVAIVYGDRPGATSVAASGDIVAVVFEEPSGSAARVGLALSHTMGHIFEDRIVPVSDDNGTATQPLVAVSARQIAVGWREGADERGNFMLRVRAGHLH
jgi:hypothetical protein